ncbi:MT0933-like antitoxin protein [Sinosporangium album]|uniref:MT0933-like antitoxin protein n=2 Tax=Sinosporangium album TaxID=504805 RepID=A0A1G7S1M5_9ACTN|nr:MT0933-like antitoxin protein [Sinosporangium album]
MSLMDKLRGLLGQHADKAEKIAKQGIDRAADLAKRRTGGKYDQHIDSAATKAREAAERIDDRPGASERAPGQSGPGQPGTPPSGHNPPPAP